MRMKKVKTLMFVCALTFAMAAMTGCGGKKESDVTADPGTVQTTEDTGTSGGSKAAEDTTEADNEVSEDGSAVEDTNAAKGTDTSKETEVPENADTTSPKDAAEDTNASAQNAENGSLLEEETPAESTGK